MYVGVSMYKEEKCLFCIHGDDSGGCMLNDDIGDSAERCEAWNRFEPFDSVFDMQEAAEAAEQPMLVPVGDEKTKAEEKESLEPADLEPVSRFNIRPGRYKSESDNISFPGGLLYSLMRNSVTDFFLWPLRVTDSIFRRLKRSRVNLKDNKKQ